MRIQTQFLWINLIGGIAVLGGYIIALIYHPETRTDLWGDVPINWRPWIVTSMFFAGFGYCYAIYYMVYNDGLSLQFFWGRVDAAKMIILLILFLSSASLWIHTTFSYIDSPTYLKWAFVQAELWITAFSILLMTIGLATASGVEQPLKHNISILGLSLISFHCLVLDAMLWINKFPRSDL